MEKNYKLSDNPFYVLEVTPREDADRLINAASDLELLSGISTQELVDQLLRPGGRLAAETAYMPAAAEGEIGRIRDYLRSAGEAPVPELGMHSALARFNAAAAILEYWPVKDAAGAEAACLVLAGLSRDIAAEDVMKEINSDREAGGYEVLAGPQEAAGPLREHLSNVFAGLGKRCTKLAPGEFHLLKRNLAEKYCGDNVKYRHLPALSEIVRRHLGHTDLAAVQTEENIIRGVMEQYAADEEIPYSGESRESSDEADNERSSRSEAIKRREEFLKRKQTRRARIEALLKALRSWDELTGPERMIVRAGGFTEKNAEALFDDLHSFLVRVVNDWGDIPGAKDLVRTLYEIFTDISVSKREILEKNYMKLCG